MPNQFAKIKVHVVIFNIFIDFLIIVIIFLYIRISCLFRIEVHVITLHSNNESHALK